MITPPLTAPNSQYVLVVTDHEHKVLGYLPYRNLQGETFLNQSHQLRGEIPFRDYSWITPALLMPGKHELRLIDQLNGICQFAGPIWDATAGSDTGVVSISAQCPLSYLTSRRLDAASSLTAGQPADGILALITYTNGISPLHFTASKVTSNAQTVTIAYAAADGHMLNDLLTDLAAMGDGVDYYTRVTGSLPATGVPNLFLYGGKLASSKNLASWTYGGVLKQYSLQINAQAMANDVKIIGSNGVAGTASDSASQTANDMLYQSVDTGSDLTSLANLNAAAATALKSSKNAIQIPSLVVKDLIPTVDFDLGDKRLVVIDDGWAQYNGYVRITGWQLTVGTGDNITTTIYTNDTSEVT